MLNSLNSENKNAVITSSCSPLGHLLPSTASSSVAIPNSVATSSGHILVKQISVGNAPNAPRLLVRQDGVCDTITCTASALPTTVSANSSSARTRILLKQHCPNIRSDTSLKGFSLAHLKHHQHQPHVITTQAGNFAGIIDTSRSNLAAGHIVIKHDYIINGQTAALLDTSINGQTAALLDTSINGQTAALLDTSIPNASKLLVHHPQNGDGTVVINDRKVLNNSSIDSNSSNSRQLLDTRKAPENNVIYKVSASQSSSNGNSSCFNSSNGNSSSFNSSNGSSFKAPPNYAEATKQLKVNTVSA